MSFLSTQDDDTDATAAAVGFQESDDLINITTAQLFLCMLPIFFIAFLSNRMGLHLERPLLVGVVRVFVQLSVLGAVLAPIFTYGRDRCWVVLLYVAFMLILATRESTARCTYVFPGMLWRVALALVISIALASALGFGVILQPHPIWNPHYAIPIVGMLLGNAINGMALSVNAVTTCFVEQQREIEVLLSFGASPSEASARMVRTSVRVGATPTLNGMAVIGIISIPGMMTGQILGGTPPAEAAAYQMFICYLIAMSSFATILLQVWLVQRVGFHRETHMLEAYKFTKRTKSAFLKNIGSNFVERIKNLLEGKGFQHYSRDPNSSPEALPLMSVHGSLSKGNGTGAVTSSTTFDPTITTSGVVPENAGLQVHSVRSALSSNQENSPKLELLNVSKSFDIVALVDQRAVVTKKTLFQKFSLELRNFEVIAIAGPSGIGKSQLLRLIAALSPMDNDGGELLFLGNRPSSNPEQWRLHVRYVSQYKIDIPGTPRDLIEMITSFKVWKQNNMPPAEAILASSTKLVQSWGLEQNSFESEWKNLSGGECQRVYLAIALCSKPKVLLLDESTSALDVASKQRVEQSVNEISSELGVSVIWITHDQEQLQRICRGSV
jgi:putative ABC transport system permease protein